MRQQSSTVLFALLAAISAFATGAQAFDDAKYPDLRGQWKRAIGDMPRFDQSKPVALAEGAPLTPEYQAVFAANLADMAAGGQGNVPTFRCLAPGMPMMMIAYWPMEIVVMPDTTHILIDNIADSHRRIFTDGRDWPVDPDPAYVGYSIGKWIDEDGDGRYDVLEVETRDFKGPRVYDTSGLPLHPDNQSIIKERIYLDKADRNLLHDEITVIDHALTRPWTVIKSYRRDPNPRPDWPEDVCAENNLHVQIGKENYYLSADGLLMPTKKNQAPPDLRYFNHAKK